MNIKQKIEEYISESPIKTLYFIFLLFGGLVFFIYYLEIKYLPEINLLGSIQLLTFASVTGVLLVFSTIIMLIFPGLFWQSYIKDSFDKLDMWSGNQINKIIWFILPIILIYISIISYGYISIKYQTLNFFIQLLIPIVINSLWVIVFLYQVNKLVPVVLLKKTFFSEYVKFVFFSCLSSVISALPILIFSFVFLQEYQQNISRLVFGVLAITILIIVSNLLVIIKPNHINSIYWYSVLGFMSFLSIISLTGQTAIFPKAIMKTYKLGNIQPLSVIIDKQGCLNINKSLKSHQATNEKGEIIQFEIEDDSCIISNININILSRIGGESYVEIYNLKAKAGTKTIDNIRFPIPSSSINTWNLTNK